MSLDGDRRERRKRVLVKIRGVGAVRAILTLAVDWPGWCRSGREEKVALQALIDYGPRYAQVLQASGVE